MLKVGIVIPTIGRECITNCLAALQGQDYDELVIIRDRSKNVSNARNRGQEKLLRSVDVIAFIDDDTIPDPDFVEQGRKFFEDKQYEDVDLMQGGVYGQINTSSSYMFVAANLWVKTEFLYDNDIEWDEDFVGGGQHEDLCFGWDVLDEDGIVAFNGKCAVEHPGPNGSSPLPQNTEYIKKKHPKRWAKLQKTNSSV